MTNVLEDSGPLPSCIVGGIPVTPFESVSSAASFLCSADGAIRPGVAVAVNAEKIVRSRRDPDLREMLRGATLCYPDGVSIVWTLRQKGVRSARIPGVELWEALMARAGSVGCPVFLLGATPEVNQAVRERLFREHSVQFAGFADGYSHSPEDLVAEVVRSDPRIITVAMGSPRQELFIERCRKEHSNAFYMGVGGSYDVYAGRVARAPEWMREHGLEWLYRLIRQPNRAVRYLDLIRYFALYARRAL